MFLRGTFRIVLNVHSLNTEGAVGNYNPLVKVFTAVRVGDKWDIIEANAVSGNMLKHWHAKHLAEIAKSKNMPLCDDCKRGVFFRTRLKVNSEDELIKKCVIDDIHGFLSTETTVKRESLFKVSFAVPVEEIGAKIVSVTHNRVVTEESGKIAKDGMMPFKNEYASGIYAFAVAFDAKYTGIPLANPSNKAIDDAQRRERVKIAIAALGNMLQGEMGAKMSRALPISKTIQSIVVVSKVPVPAPTHAYFKDYAQETIKSYEHMVESGLVNKDDIEIHVYGLDVSSDKVNVVKHSTIQELIADVAKAADRWL